MLSPQVATEKKAPALFVRGRLRKGYSFSLSKNYAEAPTTLLQSPGPGYYVPKENLVVPHIQSSLFGLSGICTQDSRSDDSPAFLHQDITFSPSGGFTFGAGLVRDSVLGRSHGTHIMRRNIRRLAESKPESRIAQLLRSKRLREEKLRLVLLEKESMICAYL